MSPMTASGGDGVSVTDVCNLFVIGVNQEVARVKFSENSVLRRERSLWQVLRFQLRISSNHTERCALSRERRSSPRALGGVIIPR